MSLDIKAVAIQRLMNHHGWTYDRVPTLVVTKMYQTFNGPRQAIARIRDDREYPQHWMDGEYWSEGNNAISTCYACIPADADLDSVHAHVDKFANDIEHAVGQTYAMKLLVA